MLDNRANNTGSPGKKKSVVPPVAPPISGRFMLQVSKTSGRNHLAFGGRVGGHKFNSTWSTCTGPRMNYINTSLLFKGATMCSLSCTSHNIQEHISCQIPAVKQQESIHVYPETCTAACTTLPITTTCNCLTCVCGRLCMPPNTITLLELPKDG